MRVSNPPKVKASLTNCSAGPLKIANGVFGPLGMVVFHVQPYVWPVTLPPLIPASGNMASNSVPDK